MQRHGKRNILPQYPDNRLKSIVYTWHKHQTEKVELKKGQIAKYILAQCQAHVNKPWA